MHATKILPALQSQIFAEKKIILSIKIYINYSKSIHFFK